MSDTSEAAPKAGGGNVWEPERANRFRKTTMVVAAAAIVFFILPLFFWQDYPHVNDAGEMVIPDTAVGGQMLYKLTFHVAPTLIGVILLTTMFILTYLGANKTARKQSQLFYVIVIFVIVSNTFNTVTGFYRNIDVQSNWISDKLGHTGIVWQDGWPADVTNWNGGSTQTVSWGDGSSETFTVQRDGNTITGLTPQQK